MIYLAIFLIVLGIAFLLKAFLDLDIAPRYKEQDLYEKNLPEEKESTPLPSFTPPERTFRAPLRRPADAPVSVSAPAPSLELEGIFYTDPDQSSRSFRGATAKLSANSCRNITYIGNSRLKINKDKFFG